jgi:hypothetical protein
MHVLPARLLLYAVICLSVLLCGCGTPGVPQPPSLNLAKPVSDLRAVRTGDQVELTWTIPTETNDHATFRHPGQTKVCEATDQPQLSQCNAVLTLPAQNQKSATATVPITSAGPNDYATFAIEVDNDRGRNAGLSNQVQVPTAAVSKVNATRNQLTPSAILVTTDVREQGPAVSQTLELRRRDKATSTPQESAVARRPIEISELGANVTLELRDETFAWEKTYEYRVVIVGSAKVPNGNVVTFDASTSTPFEVFAHDTFPPDIPTGLQAVFSGQGQVQGQVQGPSIDLTWNPDMERDLSGYFIYRRLQGEPASAAVKLNAQPVSAPAFRDSAIQPGRTYVYSVSAVDEHGNESKRSEESSEQVPQG